MSEIRTPNTLNEEEINKVYASLMDSSLQKKLMDSLDSEEENPDIWILDYIHDSQLRKDLDEYVLYKEKAQNLSNNLKEKESDKPQVKI